MKTNRNIITRFVRANLITAPFTVAVFSTAQAQAPLSEIAIGPAAGTPGFGVEASVPLWPGYVNLNGGYQDFGITYRATTNQQGYNASLRLGGVPLFLSFYPLPYGIHFDAGIFINNNRISVDAIPNDGRFIFDGHTYNSNNLGEVSGGTQYNRVAPYLGVGWGDPFKGKSNWTFTANAGVILEGGSNAQLTSSNEKNVPGAAYDLSIADQTFNDDTRFMTIFPVVNVGLTYRF